jgi:hypothetical protein
MKILLKIIGYGILFFITLFIVLGVIGYNVMKDDRPTNPQNDTKVTSTAPTKNENWNYSTSLVGIDKEKMSWIETRSLNSLNLKFPYNGINRGELTIRKSKGKTELIFTINKGQILCDLYTCKGRIKFDSSPSILFTGDKPSNGTSNMIFISNSSDFIQRIKKSKSVSIEVELYQEGNQILDFNVENLNLDYFKNDSK